MKIFLIAGETSSDMHAAALARAILARRPDVRLLGMGGAAMAAAGVEIVQPIDDMQIMGFVEVVGNYRRIKAVFDGLASRFRDERPDALVLVDYPGFNLRFAASVRDTGAKILYYISPQVWAWHRSRLKTMRRLIDRMLVIFDFEKPFYERAGIPVEFVGHPLLDRLEDRPGEGALRKELGLAAGQRLVALLPGSRKQEVQRIFPRFTQAAAMVRKSPDDGPAVRFVAASPPGREDLYDGVHNAGESGAIPVLTGRTHEVIRAADLAWVSSGTATIETALLGTPLICCYRGGALSYALVSLLVNMPCVSLVNIVAGRPVIPELLQYRFTPRRLADLAQGLLHDESAREAMRAAFAAIRERLGGPGASARAAAAVLAVLAA